MCVRYRNEKTNLSVWAAEYHFAGIEQLADASEFFPGAPSGVIASRMTGEQTLSNAYWGMTPHWAKDPLFGKKNAYNARCETLHEKATYKTALKSRRCLIPANAFFERNSGRWIKFENPNHSTFAFAGLYEPPNKIIPSVSYTMITTEPNTMVSSVHDRMPVILPANAYEQWLNPKSSESELRALLVACPNDFLRFEDAGPVGRKKAAASETPAS